MTGIGRFAAIFLGLLAAGAGCARQAGPTSLAAGEFHLVDPAKPGQPREFFARGAALTAGSPDALFGTYVGGDGFVGEARSPDFQILTDSLVVPIAGFPRAEGNSLALEIIAGDGSRFALVPYQGVNPAGTIAPWRIPVGQWWRMRGRIVLRDGRTGDQGWLAVGTPGA